MRPFDILDPSLPIHRSWFLEASAGTGKTFAIEHLIVRLLTEGQTPFVLPEILAVTFTREAADEMRERIRAQLKPQEGDDPTKARRRREAFLALDQIQVFTIHGFCQRILSEFAFEANLSLQTGPNESSDWIEAMRETVLDFFRMGSPEYGGELAQLTKKMRYDLPRLVEKIVASIQNDPTPKPFSLADPLPIASAAEIEADVKELASRYKRFNIDGYAHQFEKLAEFLETKQKSLLLEEKSWFFEKMEEENAKVSAPPLSTYTLAAPTLWETLPKLLTPKLETVRDPEQMVRRLADACRKHWEVRAEREELMSFDDLLQQMAKAIDKPLFVEKVRAKYKAVIVDEFQDTDPLQWEIFERLFLENHLLYLVGDPKQSIYGFRSADIYTYMGALEKVGKEKRGTLDTNFRSSPQLITLLNRLFTQKEGWIDLPSLPGSLTYTPVYAGRGPSPFSESAIEGVVVEGAQGRERSWPTKRMEEESLFPYIGKEVIRLHEKHKIPFEQMAILVKDRFQAERLQRHLQKWNLPSNIKRTTPLTKTVGFIAFEQLIEGVESPGDERKTGRVLHGPLPLNHPDLFALHHLFVEKGFPLFFETLFAHADFPLHDEISQIGELLIEKGAHTFADVLHLLDRWKKGGPDQEEKLTLRSSGAKGLPIMTTFASKGLEFDVVFAIGLASRHYGEKEEEEREAEKMRQLYVGLTRPREKLYLPLLIDREERPIPPGTGSPLELFFADWENPLADRLHQLEIPTNKIESIPITPFTPEVEEAPQLIAPPQLLLDFPTPYLSSFTAMAKSTHQEILSQRFQKQNLAEKTLHTMPLGAETGTLIHTLFESHLAEPHKSLEELICKQLAYTPLEDFEEVIADGMREILDLPLLPDFTLSSLKEGEYMQEMEFFFPQEDLFIKGFADLVFQHQDKFYLLDWKTNWLGPSDDDYTEENLHKAMVQHDYYLQAKLYAEGLGRYVKQFYNDLPPDWFGGAIYLFFRGKTFTHFGSDGMDKN